MEDQELQQEYEIGYLLKAETDREAIHRLLKQHEAVITTEGPMRLTTLSYPIDKVNQAVFGWTRFTTNRGTLPGLEHDIKMSSAALRYLIVKAEPLPAPTNQVAAGDGGAPTEGGETPVATTEAATDSAKSAALSNEDIEKKIEEILK